MKDPYLDRLLWGMEHISFHIIVGKLNLSRNLYTANYKVILLIRYINLDGGHLRSTACPNASIPNSCS